MNRGESAEMQSITQPAVEKRIVVAVTVSFPGVYHLTVVGRHGRGRELSAISGSEFSGDGLIIPARISLRCARTARMLTCS